MPIVTEIPPEPEPDLSELDSAALRPPPWHPDKDRGRPFTEPLMNAEECAAGPFQGKISARTLLRYAHDRRIRYRTFTPNGTIYFTATDVADFLDSMTVEPEPTPGTAAEIEPDETNPAPEPRVQKQRRVRK